MGCTTTVDHPVLYKSPPPVALLTPCKEQPDKPNIVTDADLGNYIVDLAEAGADCRTRFNSIRSYLQ
jgi:hypothetical protein